MIRMPGLVKEFLKEDSGQGLVEYLLVVALIALAVIAGMQGSASKIASAFETVGNKLSNAVGT